MKRITRAMIRLEDSLYAHLHITVLRMSWLPEGVRALDQRGWPLFEQAAAWTKGTYEAFSARWGNNGSEIP
eukprot:gene12014-biopygen9694